MSCYDCFNYVIKYLFALTIRPRATNIMICTFHQKSVLNYFKLLVLILINLQNFLPQIKIFMSLTYLNINSETLIKFVASKL